MSMLDLWGLQMGSPSLCEHRPHMHLLWTHGIKASFSTFDLHLMNGITPAPFGDHLVESIDAG
jgi:hypothetical protein